MNAIKLNTNNLVLIIGKYDAYRINLKVCARDHFYSKPNSFANEYVQTKLKVVKKICQNKTQIITNRITNYSNCQARKDNLFIFHGTSHCGNKRRTTN